MRCIAWGMGGGGGGVGRGLSLSLPLDLSLWTLWGLSSLDVFRGRSECCDPWDGYEAGNNVLNHRVTDVDLVIAIKESFEHAQLSHSMDE